VEAHEAVEHVEKSHEAAASHHHFARTAAIVVAVLAMLLAVASLAGNRASGNVLLDQQKASDTYNEAQANSLKRHVSENTSLLLRSLPLAGSKATAAATDAATIDRTVDQKYRPSEDRLIPMARQFEHDRDAAETQDNNLHLSEVTLQIAIVLTSVAILLGRMALVWGGSAVGVLGAALLANGLWSVVHLP
jgi:Domain of unknown function (DUF4337)